MQKVFVITLLAFISSAASFADNKDCDVSITGVRCKNRSTLNEHAKFKLESLKLSVGKGGNASELTFAITAPARSALGSNTSKYGSGLYLQVDPGLRINRNGVKGLRREEAQYGDINLHYDIINGRDSNFETAGKASLGGVQVVTLDDKALGRKSQGVKLTIPASKFEGSVNIDGEIPLLLCAGAQLMGMTIGNHQFTTEEENIESSFKMDAVDFYACAGIKVGQISIFNTTRLQLDEFKDGDDKAVLEYSLQNTTSARIVDVLGFELGPYYKYSHHIAESDNSFRETRSHIFGLNVER